MDESSELGVVDVERRWWCSLGVRGGDVEGLRDIVVRKKPWTATKAMRRATKQIENEISTIQAAKHQLVPNHDAVTTPVTSPLGLFSHAIWREIARGPASCTKHGHGTQRQRESRLTAEFHHESTSPCTD